MNDAILDEAETTQSVFFLNGYEAKVYVANNVNVVTKIRTEHLTEEEKKRYKGSFPVG